MTNRIARTCALSGVLALAFAGALTPAANAATVVPTLDADLTPVTLLGTNDFHGHFTKDFACTVASAEQVEVASLEGGREAQQRALEPVRREHRLGA